MTAAGYPTGTVTFLFTDIEGSTRLWEAYPDDMRAALAAHDAILRAAVEAASGVVFKTVGDAFCAAFALPATAVTAAVDAQLRLAAHTWPARIGRLRVRMGVHTGAAVETGGDYFGPTVNRVARLMSLGYGEQILVSGASFSLLHDALPAGVLLRDLGTHRLKDLSRAEPAFQVLASGLRTDFPALASLDALPNNLPFQISSFVGREREQREVHDALTQHRLVTIVGSGGIGKTRLALHVAGDSIGDYAAGAWFVGLSTVRTSALMAQAAADVLHVREQPQLPVEETVAAAIGDGALLLLLDGSEHLVADAATFVKLLLNRCPSLKVLVTSREPLHLTGERVVRIAALEDARALFTDRAHEVMPGLEFEPADGLLIDEICRRLDGIPLAIELAAARVTTLPLATLNGRLSRSLSVLVSRDSTIDVRHRTLRDTIGWSYELLDALEATVLRSLAVFEGSFSIAAAAGVTAAAEDEAADVLETLVGKSLVSAVFTADAARYALLDTIREYLAEVTEETMAHELHARHFDHYERFASAMTANQRPREIGRWLDTIEMEISNLRGALEWGLAHRPPEAAKLVANLSRYLKSRGHISEGRTWFRRFLDAPGIADVDRAALLRRAATFATEQDAYEEARALNAECLALYERMGAIGGIAEAMHNFAVIEQRGGHTGAAAARYAAAIERFREAGNDYGLIVALVNLALLAFARDDLDEGERRIGEAAAAVARSGDADLRGHVVAARGELSLRKGDNEAAARYFREAVAIKRTLGNRQEVADAENSLAAAAIREGRVAEAVASARETMRTALDLEVSSLVIFGFEAFCEIAVHERRYEDAALYYGLSVLLRDAYSYRNPAARDMAAIERELRAQLAERYDTIAESCARADWRTVAAGLARAG
jgi:predicted ATPase/class 3 adenylate cyclase